jgi:RimJ/RimL family protein N-acetyltransferase
MRNLELRTERLLLRRLRPDDVVPFAAMNADPRVMEYFEKTVSLDQSLKLIEKIERGFAEHGFGWWAVEIPGVTSFAGVTGISVPEFHAHFTPCVETGWRFAFDYWNRGYATEAARAAVAFGFGTIQLDEIVAFTVPANVRSRRVMEKLGMTRNPDDDFDHPRLPEGHPLQRHVLYRLRVR